jgi:hypothetical protein
MLPLPAAIIAVLLPFAPVFSRPVWCHVQVLLVGAVLCRGPRTVAAVLRVMGLGHEKRFEKYPRVLSRARWSGFQGSKILLGLLVQLLPSSWLIVIGTDYAGAPAWAADHCPGLLSRCRPIDGEACGHVFWAEMGHHDAGGSLALEPTTVGLTLFDDPKSDHERFVHAYLRPSLGSVR